MNAKAMSLKAKIRNLAKKKHLPAQVVLQNYMFERFLLRLSMSEYKDNFVVKGGMLVAAIVGLANRSTMDLDTMLKNLPMTKKTIMDALKEIFLIDLADDVTFEIKRIEPIRDDDVYGGYRIMLHGNYDTITVPLSIDATTGDAITPEAQKHVFHCLFDKESAFEIWAYNIETILGEKVETILRRSVFNTRPRDFYDAYILLTTQPYDKRIFQKAILETAKHRETIGKIKDIDNLLTTIENSNDLQKMWDKYSRQFYYAKGITYEMIINELRKLLL